MELSTPPNLKGSKVAVLGSSLDRGLGSYPQLGGGGKFLRIVRAESMKQKENVPNINWSTTLIWGGGGAKHSLSTNLFITINKRYQMYLQARMGGGAGAGLPQPFPPPLVFHPFHGVVLLYRLDLIISIYLVCTELEKFS